MGCPLQARRYAWTGARLFAILPCRVRVSRPAPQSPPASAATAAAPATSACAGFDSTPSLPYCPPHYRNHFRLMCDLLYTTRVLPQDGSVTQQGPQSTRPLRSAVEALDTTLRRAGTCYREDTIPRPFFTGRLRQG